MIRVIKTIEMEKEVFCKTVESAYRMIDDLDDKDYDYIDTIDYQIKLEPMLDPVEEL